MKPSVRLLFNVLLFIISAATVSLLVVVLRGSSSIQLDTPTHFVTTDPVVPKKPVFNATLLNLASFEIVQPQLKKEIEQVLEGNFWSRHRSYLSYRKHNVDVWARWSRGIPIQLRSPQFYRMWLDFRKHLQDWSRKRVFHSDVMLGLVNLVNGSIERYNGLESSGKKYSSCAVVGNSGILLKNDHGRLIDSHEVVIRLNNARIGRFQRNVGSKTSISFVNSNILHLCARKTGCFCHPYGDNVPIIMYICQPVHFMDYTLCNSSHKSPLLITDPRFDVTCGRIVKYYSLKRFMNETGKVAEEWGSAHDGPNFHYSSGMQAVLLAVGVCEKVSIFGFGKSNSTKHHYHTNQKAELKLHDYEAEYDFYRDLVEKPQVIPFISEKFKFPPVVVYQ